MILACRRLFRFSKEAKKEPKNIEEASSRDHRSLGVKQQLFSFTKYAPGSAMFYPHGSIIYNKLIDLMRS